MLKLCCDACGTDVDELGYFRTATKIAVPIPTSNPNEDQRIVEIKLTPLYSTPVALCYPCTHKAIQKNLPHGDTTDG